MQEKKQHVCPECDKRFARAGYSQGSQVNSYRRKNMYVKTGTKNMHKLHACPECGKRFARDSYIKQHLLIHTGVKNNMHVQNVVQEVAAAIQQRCP